MKNRHFLLNLKTLKIYNIFLLVISLKSDIFSHLSFLLNDGCSPSPDNDSPFGTSLLLKPSLFNWILFGFKESRRNSLFGQ